MKKILIIIYFLFSAIIYSQDNTNAFLSALTEWYSNPEVNKPISYELEDCLNYNNVVKNEETYDLFSEDYFTITRTSDVYCSEIHINGIQDKTLALLLHNGSGRFPCFYLFVFETKSNLYKIALTIEKDLYPIIINNSYYFVEEIRDYDSGRYYDYNIFNIDSNFVLNAIACYHKKYTYNLDSKISKYINSDEINQIAEQDYSFIGIDQHKPTKIETNIGPYLLESNIRYTSVGYFATTMNLVLTKPYKEKISYNQLWGFKTVQINSHYYLITLAMDKKYPMSSIETFNLQVIDIDSNKIIENIYIKPQESFY